MNSAMFGGLARHLLTFAGGFLVQKGYLDAQGVEIIVGAVIAVGGVVWSAFQKKQAEKPNA